MSEEGMSEAAENVLRLVAVVEEILTDYDARFFKMLLDGVEWRHAQSISLHESID